MPIRNIDTEIWNDPKVSDAFTPEDKLFWFFCLTNPLGNLSGVSEISYNQMVKFLGFSEQTVKNLIYRFEEIHKLITYVEDTKELFIHNWHKYNWTKSPKFEQSLFKFINKIKDDRIRESVTNMYDQFKNDLKVEVTPIDNMNLFNLPSETVEDTTKLVKHKYGEFKNVLLTEDEHEKLMSMAFGKEYLEKLSIYIGSKGAAYKSHYLTILNWLRRDGKEKGVEGQNGKRQATFIQ